MTKNTQKLCLYIEHDAVDYDVWPTAERIAHADACAVHHYQMPVGERLNVRIKLNNKHNAQGFLRIKNIELNGIPLQGLPYFGRYVTDSGKVIHDAHGYMGDPGVYFIHIKQNALVHNYLSSLIQTTDHHDEI